ALIHPEKSWDVSPAQKSAARRNLALIVAGKNDYRELLKALALLDESKNSDKNELPEAADERSRDERVRAILLATHPGRQKEAIEVLERSSRDLPLNPDERFLLAQLYAGNDNPTKFRQHMLTLLADSENPQPTHLVMYVRELLRLEKTEEAAGWLKKLEE